MRIAFAGNPNSGKTTMFNALTGRSERVGNWAGVTVDKKEALIKKQFTSGLEVVAVDLPGAYSMSPFTNEESITSQYVKNEKVDAIINIVDATNLSRSLFFTTQLLELGIPLVIALNKSDINQKKETEIDINNLSKLLKCPIVETISTNYADEGLKKVVEKAIEIKGYKQEAPFSDNIFDKNDKKAYELSDRKRFAFVNDIVKKVEKRKILTKEYNYQDKIDSFLTNKFVGLLVFAGIMFGVFYISQTTIGPLIANILNSYIEMLQKYVGGLLENASAFTNALVVDGIIGGVGAVLGFLPLVMVMYFLIALLEDCGYMARASVVLDPIFKKVGLSGKSVIPFVIATGCSIPGIMASRTIRNERERNATAMLSPFMPCGAKLPVIALFAGVFFKDASWVGPLMYFVGIIFIFVGAYLVNKITGYNPKKSYFIIELPEYKLPSLKRAVLSMFDRGKSYIIKAGTIILVCNTIVQLMQSFTWSLQLVEEGAEITSILASIASPFAFVLVPLGFGVWQLAAAAITGFIAKENVVGTLAVCYGITSFIDVDEFVLINGASEVAMVIGLTKVAALAYLMFNLFTPPCFAAIGAMNAEISDKKWLFAGIALQFAVGYTCTFIVYQVGSLITLGQLGQGFILGLAIVSILIFAFVILMKKTKKAQTING